MATQLCWGRPGKKKKKKVKEPSWEWRAGLQRRVFSPAGRPHLAPHFAESVLKLEIRTVVHGGNVSEEGLEEEGLFRRMGIIVMVVIVPPVVGVEEHGRVLLELLRRRQRAIVVVVGNELLIEELLGRLDDLKPVAVLVLVVGGDVGGADARKHVGVVEVDELVDLGVAPLIEICEGGVEEELLLEVNEAEAPCTAGGVRGETHVPLGVLACRVVGEVDVCEDDEQGHQLQLRVYTGLGHVVEGEVEAKNVHTVLDELDDAKWEEQIEDDTDQEREVV